MQNFRQFSLLKSTVGHLLRRDCRQGLSTLTRSLLVKPRKGCFKSYSTLMSKDLAAPSARANYNVPCLTSVRGAAQVSADQDLSTFLEREVVLEAKMSKVPRTGNRVPGFALKEDGSTIVLEKKFKDEDITVRLNVNGSMIASGAGLPQEGNEAEAGADGDLGEMRSKPDFSVEIKKPSGRTLVISCTFYDAPEDPESTEAPPETEDDLFQIENFYIMKSEDLDKDEWKDNTYMGDGSLIDGEMYDLLMNYLDERSINNEFAEALMEYCTYYEHQQYIRLLKSLKDFVEGK